MVTGPNDEPIQAASTHVGLVRSGVPQSRLGTSHGEGSLEGRVVGEVAVRAGAGRRARGGGGERVAATGMVVVAYLGGLLGAFLLLLLALHRRHHLDAGAYTRSLFSST